MQTPNKTSKPWRSPETEAHSSALLTRLYNHRATMDPHQKERHTGKLLLECIAELERLNDAIRLTLEENCHLADGDNCTLMRLKRAYAPNAQGEAQPCSPFVVHCKRAKYDIYIGRPSKWGNPFEIGRDGDRQTVIHKYREWVVTQPQLMAALPELRGKVMGCWCAPQACHGDVLVSLANDQDHKSPEHGGDSK